MNKENSTKEILTVAIALALWGQTRIYNYSPHSLHRLAMIIGGTSLYALGRSRRNMD